MMATIYQIMAATSVPHIVYYVQIMPTAWCVKTDTLYRMDSVSRISATFTMICIHANSAMLMHTSVHKEHACHVEMAVEHATKRIIASNATQATICMAADA